MPSPIVILSIPFSFSKHTTSSITREVVITPHLGIVTCRFQYTIFGLMNTFADVGTSSRPCITSTAFWTDSCGFSYLTRATFDFSMESRLLFLYNEVKKKSVSNQYIQE